jgi:predicted DNA-binding transcriptional regulator YafY
MCQAFTKHLLGKEQLLESEKALQKSSTIAAGTGGADHFAVFLPGTIDYTPRQKDIRQLMRAMDERIVCKIVYKNAFEETEKTFYIKPYKLFSYNNALYLHAGMARYPGSKKFEFDFDPLLAVHRLQKVTLTEKGYDFPRNYNFEKQFNQTFGIIKEDAFKVKLELEGYAAVYAQERKFSPDQKIRINKDEKYILTFTASSEPEVLAWVLSHGAEVKVLSPEWLVEDVKEKVKAISKRYCNN